MSERLSQGEIECFDKMFHLVRDKGGTLDKIEELSRQLFILSGFLSANRENKSPYDDAFKDANNLIAAFEDGLDNIKIDWGRLISLIAQAHMMKEQREKG